MDITSRTIQQSCCSCQETVLVLIHSHLLKRLCRVNRGQLSLPCFMRALPNFFTKVAQVSQRFMKIIVPSVNVMLGSCEFVIACKDLEKLFAIASSFGFKVSNVYLKMDAPLSPLDLINYAPFWSGLELHSHHLCSYDFQFSLFFYPRLRQLEISAPTGFPFRSFGDSLLKYPNIIDLLFEIPHLYKNQEILHLSEMISTLRIPTLGINKPHGLPSQTEEVQNIFRAIGSNTSIQRLFLRSFVLTSSASIAPIFKCNSLKTVRFPLNGGFDSSVVDCLRNNATLRHIILNRCQSNSTEIAEVLKSNIYLKKLVIKRCSFDFIPLFRSLLFNNSLNELEIHDSQKPLTCKEVDALVEMLQRNTGLFVLNLAQSIFRIRDFERILGVLENNSILKKVYFPFLDFKSLILLFEKVVNNISLPPYNTYPNLIDVTRGYIRHPYLVDNSCLVTLLDALQRNVPINRVKYRGFKNRSLAMVTTLVQIRSINSSVLKFDNFDHRIDLKRGLFVFSPRSATRITHEDIESLQSFLQCFSFTRLVFQRCDLDRVISSLCHLIKTNNMLTSVHFNSVNIVEITCIIDVVFAHSIDVTRRSICYEKPSQKFDLEVVLYDLESKVPIKHVYCRGFQKYDENIHLQPPCPKNKSADFAEKLYHCMDIENKTFTFSPLASKEMTKSVVHQIYHLIDWIGIKDLKFMDCRFTDDVLIAICELIKVDASVTTIDFSGCRLCDSHFQGIVTALFTNSSIVEFNFSHNSIGDLSVSPLLTLLKTNTIIDKIDLSDNLFTIDRLKTFAELDNRNSSVTENTFESSTDVQESEVNLGGSLKGRILFD
ncbi:hypothetical protein GEMRC1_000829 [Eukaryota sp. GEM-RC1]